MYFYHILSQLFMRVEATPILYTGVILLKKGFYPVLIAVGHVNSDCTF